MSSNESRSPSRGRSKSKDRGEKHKLFVTNLEGTVKE